MSINCNNVLNREVSRYILRILVAARGNFSICRTTQGLHPHQVLAGSGAVLMLSAAVSVAALLWLGLRGRVGWHFVSAAGRMGFGLGLALWLNSVAVLILCVGCNGRLTKRGDGRGRGPLVILRCRAPLLLALNFGLASVARISCCSSVACHAVAGQVVRTRNSCMAQGCQWLTAAQRHRNVKLLVGALHGQAQAVWLLVTTGATACGVACIHGPTGVCLHGVTPSNGWKGTGYLRWGYCCIVWRLGPIFGHRCKL